MLEQKPAFLENGQTLKPEQRFHRLSRDERRALEDYVSRLRAKYADRIRRVALFGSRARLEGDRESDLDVLVVIDQDDRRLENEVALEAFDPSLEHNVPIAPLVWSQPHYELHRRLGLLIYRNIEQDGIDLWTLPTNAPSSSTASQLRETS